MPHSSYLASFMQTTTADWEEAFLNAVAKRVRDVKYPVFVPLSGGMDSGAIALALRLLNKDFTAITVAGDEDKHVLEKRQEVLAPHLTQLAIKLQLGTETYDDELQYLEDNVEPYFLERQNRYLFCQNSNLIVPPDPTVQYDLLSDPAAVGGSAIGRLAKGTTKNLSLCQSGLKYSVCVGRH